MENITIRAKITNNKIRIIIIVMEIGFYAILAPPTP